MKNHFNFPLLSLLLLFALSCTNPGTTAAQVSKEMSVSSFEALAISGSFETVTLVKGKEGLSFEGSDGDLAKIEVENKGNTLEIRVKKRESLNGDVFVTVGFETLKKIANSGSSDIKTASTIQGNRLSLAFSGSGDFEGDLDVEDLNIAISGSADLKLQGRADYQDIAISGSGDVDASELQGKEAKVAVSGSGDVRLNVSGRVKSAVSGSGNVSNEG